MTLLVVYNDIVLIDSCTTIGSTQIEANKVARLGDYVYACAGPPDAAQQYVEASVVDGRFDPTANLDGLYRDGSSVVLRDKTRRLWSVECLDGAQWMKLGNIQGDIQYVAGSGAEAFLTLYATGMGVEAAFNKVCDINPYVDRPIRRF